MLAKNLRSSLPQAMRLVRLLYVESIDSTFSFQQLRVMALIQEGQSQTQMANTLQVSLAAVSKLTECLVKKEFVLRKTGIDRRTQALSLTAKGKRAFDRANAYVEKELEKGIKKLNQEEKKQLEQGLNVLDQFVEIMKEVKMLFLIMFLFFSQAHAAISLKDAFSAAKLNMETLKRADATIIQREEQETRVQAALLPNVNGIGSYTRIDPPSGAGASPFLLTRQYSYALRLSQPLIRGGSLAANRLAKENILLAEFQKNATEITLYQLVINAYYNLMIARSDQKNLQELQKYSSERVRELQGRAKIGRSRRGELIEAEAQLLTSDSQFQQGSINLQQAEKVFEFYTNLKPDELYPLTETPILTGRLEDYLMKIKSRPDIMASRQLIKVADEQIGISKGGHYPSLDLNTNYYFKRTGVLSTSDWDVGVALIIPIFQGGGVQASVREAVEGKRIAELNTSETIRTAERDLAVLFQNYVQVSQQLNTLKNAMEKAGEAYRSNKKDYSNGIVTNLQVLQSLNLFIETKRSYDSLSVLAHMSYKNLEASVGVLP